MFIFESQLCDSINMFIKSCDIFPNFTSRFKTFVTWFNYIFVKCDFSCIQVTKYLIPPNAWVSIEPHIFECMISSTLVAQVLPPCKNTWRCCFFIKQLWHIGGYLIHHKLHGSQFGNNRSEKFDFHRFVWNRHGFIHLCVLFEHRYHMHCLDTNVVCLFVLFTHKSHAHNFCV